MAKQSRLEESSTHAIAGALKTGVGYAAGWGNTADDPSYVMLVVTGEVADKLRPMLDTINDLAKQELR